MTKNMDVNPLLGLTTIFEIYPKTGSYRLPTHRRGSHRKFIRWSLLYFKIEIFVQCCSLTTHAAKGWTYKNLKDHRYSSVAFELNFICWHPRYAKSAKQYFLTHFAVPFDLSLLPALSLLAGSDSQNAASRRRCQAAWQVAVGEGIDAHDTPRAEIPGDARAWKVGSRDRILKKKNLTDERIERIMWQILEIYFRFSRNYRNKRALGKRADKDN